MTSRTRISRCPSYNFSALGPDAMAARAVSHAVIGRRANRERLDPRKVARRLTHTPETLETNFSIARASGAHLLRRHVFAVRLQLPYRRLEAGNYSGPFVGGLRDRTPLRDGVVILVQARMGTSCTGPPRRHHLQISGPLSAAWHLATTIVMFFASSSGANSRAKRPPLHRMTRRRKCDLAPACATPISRHPQRHPMANCPFTDWPWRGKAVRPGDSAISGRSIPAKPSRNAACLEPGAYKGHSGFSAR